MTGFNLPPGCNVSDIPGNRPEDTKWEAIYDDFWDKKRIKKLKYGTKPTGKQSRRMTLIYKSDNYNLTDAVDTYILMAIEYGMELGAREADANNQENEGWKRLWAEEYRNPYLRQYFKALREKAKK